MKNVLKIYVVLAACVAIPLFASADTKVCDNFSDSIWIQWFADSLDLNAEISEMRNEYLFCRLESDRYEEFLSFLFSAKGKIGLEKIARELKNPVNDGIDIDKCINKITFSHVDTQFQEWLIAQLAGEVKRIKTESYEGYSFPEHHPICGFPRIDGCNLTLGQIQKAEKILAAHISKVKNRCAPNDVQINESTLKTYIRQYWGSIDERGHIIVNMQLIKNSSIHDMNIEKGIVWVCDGGCAFIDVTIDLNNGKYVITPHGYA